MNAIDFIRETAAFMAKDRPDVYTHSGAVLEMSTCIDLLREDEAKDCNIISFCSYVLIRTIEDGFEEFIFARKKAGLTIDSEDEEVTTFRYADDINLPSFADWLEEDEEGVDYEDDDEVE